MEENLNRLERKLPYWRGKWLWNKFLEPKIYSKPPKLSILFCKKLGFPMINGEVFREKITRGCLGFGRYAQKL